MRTVLCSHRQGGGFTCPWVWLPEALSAGGVAAREVAGWVYLPVGVRTRGGCRWRTCWGVYLAGECGCQGVYLSGMCLPGGAVCQTPLCEHNNSQVQKHYLAATWLRAVMNSYLSCAVIVNLHIESDSSQSSAQDLDIIYCGRNFRPQVVNDENITQDR